MDAAVTSQPVPQFGVSPNSPILRLPECDGCFATLRGSRSGVWCECHSALPRVPLDQPPYVAGSPSRNVGAELDGLRILSVLYTVIPGGPTDRIEGQYRRQSNKCIVRKRSEVVDGAQTTCTRDLASVEAAYVHVVRVSPM